MKRTFLITTTALGLIFAACSSDDDDTSTETQTVNENQPGDTGDGDAPAGNGAPTDDTAASGDSASSSEEGVSGDIDLAGNGAMAAAAGAGGAGMMGAGGSSMVGAGGAGMGGAAGAGMGPAAQPDPAMSFFVTSVGSGELGGNLGGLEGADEMCQGLADAVGAGDKTWRAYLSTDTVDARDRIGEGPWFNHGGVQIAASLEELHAEDTVFNGAPNLILDENGQNAPGPEHDILTGSNADGTAAVGLNCDNWTSDSADLTENPRVGHSDIPENTAFSPSWNAAHESANCSQVGLTQRGGAGRLYCFAID